MQINDKMNSDIKVQSGRDQRDEKVKGQKKCKNKLRI